MQIFFIGLRIKDIATNKQSKVWTHTASELTDLIEANEITRANIYLYPCMGFAAATVCNVLDIPWRAIIPFKNHHLAWPQIQRTKYHRLLRTADEVVKVDRQPDFIHRSTPPDIYAKGKYVQLGRWMGDNIKFRDGDIFIGGGEWGPFATLQIVDEVLRNISIDVTVQQQALNSKTRKPEYGIFIARENPFIDYDDVPF